MHRKKFLCWQKSFFVFYLITFLLIGNSFSAQAQNSRMTNPPSNPPTPPGVSISWDKEVGCQNYEMVRDEKLKDLLIFEEGIEPSECIRFCENSYVTYTLNNVPAGAVTTWNVTGGNIVNSTSTTCSISWGASGMGSISFTMTSGSTILNKTICVEKIIQPTALFDIAPFNQNYLITCSNQQIDFTNLSTTNNGTNLVSYFWDFGDGNTSTAFEPSHTYTSSGIYTVILTVKNECNCTDEFKIDIKVEERGFDITCPTVVCEGQSAVYSVPEGMKCGEYKWSVIGGHILSELDGQVEVLWKDVDESGFGYVTFDPSDCEVECKQLTTIKVPVVQSRGTIKGASTICLGEQARYKLPQWPTTEIQWEIIGSPSNSVEIYQTDQRNEVILTPHAAGTFTLRATYTNTLLKCSGEAMFTFKVGKPLTITGESLVCQNSTATYTNSIGSQVNWTLTTSNGTHVNTQNNQVTFNYNFTQPGNYILTANKSGFCAGKQKTITVVATPSAPTAVIGDLLVCPSSPYTYSVQNPDATSNYYWEIDPSFGQILGSDTGDDVNISFTGSFPAQVKVYRKTISPIECESAPYTITVNQIPVQVEISNDQISVCANSLASYKAFLPGSTTNLYTDGDDYTWSFENASGSVNASSLGSVTSGQGTNSIDVTWNNVNVVTTVDLVLNVSKCNINPAPKFVRTITIYPQTEITLVASHNPVCAGVLYPVTFTVQSANSMAFSGSEIVTWDFGSGSFTTPAGQFTYTTPLTNSSTGDIGQVVTAYIANGNCGPSNTVSTTVTVMPNPAAIATLTSSANTFCTAAEVNASVVVSSNTNGVTFEWFKNGGLISPLQTGTTLNIDSNMGPGAYTFQATNPNGCVAVSNPVYIFVLPCDTIDCTIPYNVTNNSSLTACGEITFSGTYTGPGSQLWKVLGPSPTDYSINGNILTGKPGNYKIIHEVTYPCNEGGYGKKIKVKDVVIPYEPDFSYVVECTETNTFNVNFIDKSIFYAPVNPQNVRFYYKLANDPSFTLVSYNASLTVFEMENLQAGNYIFRVEVDGTYPGTTTYTCSKEYTLNLQGVDPSLSIEILNLNQNQEVNCHNTAVEFGVNPTVSSGSSTLWDFDDAEAQNTMSTVSRVFTTPNMIYNVTAKVTNEFGCSRLIDTPVSIPKECFFGDIVSSPDPATVCQNETVTLTYVPDGDNCLTNANYVWMSGNTPVSGAPNSPTFTASTTGFYWVKVISDNQCEYSSPTQIKPLFKTLPYVKLIGESTVCRNESIKFTVSTNATDIQWSVDGQLFSQFDNLLEADLTGLLASGNYQVSVRVTSTEGCVNEATINITVVEAPSDIALYVDYDCNPYSVLIKADAFPYDPNTTYNWSNGENTDHIYVPDGGPYQVTATLGGCSISKQINIPKNPENYLWIFPSGCHTVCHKYEGKDPRYLVGPTLKLPYWSWNRDHHSDQTGSNSYPTPYNLLYTGNYSFTLNTGACEATSEELDYQTIACEKCEIKLVEVKDIRENQTPYCSFTYDLYIISSANYSFTATLSDYYDNVLIIPSTFTLNPGPNVIQVTVIPQSPFIGGGTTWTISGMVFNGKEYIECIYDLRMGIPRCRAGISEQQIILDVNNNTLNAEQTLNVYPNPARDLATVQYDLTSSDANLEVYDLSGRSISKNALSSAKGEIRLNTSAYQAGVYIVVVRQNNAVTMQQKLIIE